MGKAAFPIGKGRLNSFQTACRSKGRLSRLKQPYPSCFTAQPINRIRLLWENLE